jgi:hypothetical protein
MRCNRVSSSQQLAVSHKRDTMRVWKGSSRKERIKGQAAKQHAVSCSKATANFEAQHEWAKL